MKKLILLVALLTLVAFVSGAIAAATPAPAKEEKPKIEKFSGVIEKLDEMAKTFVVKGKVKKQEQSLTFAIDDKTKIARAGKAMTLADLKEKMSVSVQYKKEGDKLIAGKVTVAAPKAVRKKEGTKK
jgi:hypothetical protein